jgi:rhomboid protease GluP
MGAIMLGRKKSGSVVCPSCGKLVGVRDAKCWNCGRPYPAMWGFAPALRRLGSSFGVVQLIIVGCVALYAAALIMDPGGVHLRGFFSLLSPSAKSLFLLGASGALPVYGFGHWWTVLSAGWLHGGLLHIGFNMLWVYYIAPEAVEDYGPGRTLIIYTVASVTGFAASSTVGAYLPFLPSFLRGASLTIGASAPLFGLLGALVWYGHRVGHGVVSRQALSYAVILGVLGFVIPGVDNWAHLGGFVGGFAAARLLNPLEPERVDHLLVGLGCLLATIAAVVVSLLVGLPQPG